MHLKEWEHCCTFSLTRWRTRAVVWGRNPFLSAPHWRNWNRKEILVILLDCASSSTELPTPLPADLRLSQASLPSLSEQKSCCFAHFSINLPARSFHLVADWKINWKQSQGHQYGMKLLHVSSSCLDPHPIAACTVYLLRGSYADALCCTSRQHVSCFSQARVIFKMCYGKYLNADNTEAF